LDRFQVIPGVDGKEFVVVLDVQIGMVADVTHLSPHRGDLGNDGIVRLVSLLWAAFKISTNCHYVLHDIPPYIFEFD
jgi:hypothetical protein